MQRFFTGRYTSAKDLGRYLNNLGVMNPYICRVCDCRVRRSRLLAKEMMFGIRDSFEYDECDSCGSLQLGNLIEDLSPYYPKDYYSFQKMAENSKSPIIRFIRWTASKRAKAAIFGEASALSAMIELLKPSPKLWSILRCAGVNEDTKILDVGCGAGALLEKLAQFGVKDLAGIDPYIENDLQTPTGVKIEKRHLSELNKKFDLIMYHHALEHIPFPANELLTVNKHLDPGGRCLVRIPTPSSEVFRIYGTDWVEFDAPRHLTLISRLGMTRLAETCGFSIKHVIDDSDEWTYLASELYRLNIPLKDQDLSKHFSPSKIKSFSRRAALANSFGDGGRTAFILEKTSFA